MWFKAFHATATTGLHASAWHGIPSKHGTTVIRASYGLFYGHPPTGLNFLSDVVDGAQSPFLVAPQLLGADDLFHGRPITPDRSLHR